MFQPVISNEFICEISEIPNSPLFNSVIIIYEVNLSFSAVP